MKRLAWTLAASLALGAAAVNAASRSTLDEAEPSMVVFGGAPAQTQSRTNPYAGNPEAARAGRKLFRKHCAGCHGSDGEGTLRAPSLVSTVVRQAAPGEIEWVVRNGRIRHGMPSWSGLPEQRRWQIVTFMQSKQ